MPGFDQFLVSRSSEYFSPDAEQTPEAQMALFRQALEDYQNSLGQHRTNAD